jgi:hypothetical protein
MKKAQKRSAVREEVFWFRKDITSSGQQENTDTKIENQYAAMTINQIINGKVNTLVKNKYLLLLQH